MARNVIDCPDCDEPLRIQTDEYGERYAWCEDCEHEVSIPKKRPRAGGGRSKAKAQTASALPWVLGASSVVIVLLGVGLVVLLIKVFGNQPAPVVAQVPPATVVQPQPTPPPVAPIPAAQPAPKTAPPTTTPEPAKPVEQPTPKAEEKEKEKPKPQGQPFPGFGPSFGPFARREPVDEDSPFALPTTGGFGPAMPFGPFGQSSTPWLTVPDDPNKYGFLVKMPKAAKMSTGEDHTTFRSTFNGSNYVVRIINLPADKRVTKLDLEQGRYYADDHVSSFATSRIDGQTAYSARLGTRGTKYCSYVQIGAKLYMFVVTSSSPFPFGLSDTSVSDFVESIRFNADGKELPPGDPDDFHEEDRRPDIAEAPKKEFKPFDEVAALPNQLVTVTGGPQLVNTIYQRKNPNAERPEGMATPAVSQSKGQIHSLPDLKPIRDFSLDFAAQDLQATDKGELLSIESQRLLDGCAFYLHKHDPKEFSKSTRTRIPDKAFFTLGIRYERLPHYNIPTEMFYVVSSMWKSALHPEVKGMDSISVLRQVHMKQGEAKKPIEFNGQIQQYRVAPNGKWIVVEVDENVNGFNSGSRLAITPESGKKRYLAVCDAATFRVVKTVPLPNVLSHLEIAFDKPDTALLILTEAGETRANTDMFVMKTLHADGRTDPIDVDPVEGQVAINSIAPFQAVRLPGDDGWIIGPVGPVMHCLRFQIENKGAVVVEESRPCPVGNIFKLKITLTPDGKSVIFHDGTVMKLREFFPGMKQFISVE